MLYCDLLVTTYSDSVVLNLNLKIRKINFPPLPFDFRYMYHPVPEFQIIVGPTPLVIRVIPITSAPVIMNMILDVIGATCSRM